MKRAKFNVQQLLVVFLSLFFTSHVLIFVSAYAQTSQNVNLISKYDIPGYAYDVYVTGNYAYVANGVPDGLRIINVTDPSSLFEVGYWLTPDSAYNVYVAGDYAYISAAGSGVRIISE